MAELDLWKESDSGRQATYSRSEEHTSELQSHRDLVCRLLLEKKNACPNAMSIKNSNTKKRTDLTVSLPSLLSSATHDIVIGLRIRGSKLDIARTEFRCVLNFH